MFTGIVEEVGTVAALERGARVARLGVGARAPPARGARVARLGVGARATLEGTGVGGSIAVSGACLTIVERRADGFVFELGPETLARKALGRLAPRGPREPPAGPPPSGR